MSDVNQLTSNESRSLGVERKKGGNLHPWLNNGERSIANKYREGKLKSTSKGELKYLKSLRGKRLSMTLCGRLADALLDITWNISEYFSEFLLIVVTPNQTE